MESDPISFYPSFSLRADPSLLFGTPTFLNPAVPTSPETLPAVTTSTPLVQYQWGNPPSSGGGEPSPGIPPPLPNIEPPLYIFPVPFFGF